MSDSRFDTLTKRLAGRTSRRAALAGAGTGMAAFTLGRAAAQEATPVATPVTEESLKLLFVQHAGPTTLTPGSGDIHTLTLTGMLAQTLYFSDRPARITGALPTDAFASQFPTMFSVAPPNATLIGHLEAGAHEEEAVVLTLLSASAAAGAATLTYEVQLLDAELIGDRVFEQEPLPVLDTPREYAEAHLFIDDATLSTGDRCAQICDPLKPDPNDPAGDPTPFWQCLADCVTAQPP